MDRLWRFRHMAGDPSRYAYARAERLDLTLPPERAVETRLRSETGVAEGKIPREKLDAVAGFWLHLSRPADFAPLAELGGLEWLCVVAPFDFDLTPLVDALSGSPLTSLRIEAPLTELGPLARLTGLTRLTLEHIRAADLGPLAGLTGLEDLSVVNAPVSDLTPLANLRLSRLYLYDTRVSEVGRLDGMPSLRVLGLAGCPLRDLTGLAAFPSFMHVNLHRTPPVEDSTVLEMLIAGRMVFDLPEDDEDNDTTEEAAVPRSAAELIAAYHQAEGDHVAQFRLLPTLVATREVEAVRTYLTDSLRYSSHRGSSLTGILFQGGAGDIPFPANPWGIEATEGLEQALHRIWEPIAEFAPQFVATALQRTLALAHIVGENGDPALVYIKWGCNDDTYTDTPAWQLTRTPTPLDELAAPGADEYVQALIGTPPVTTDPDAIVPALGGPVPRPVRDLWAIHGGLGGTFSGAQIGGTLEHTVLDMCDGDWAEGLKRTGGTPPDRLIRSVGEGEFESAVLDLDILDAAGNPTVATWHWKEWGTGDHRQFWDWLDDEGTRTVWL